MPKNPEHDNVIPFPSGKVKPSPIHPRPQPAPVIPFSKWLERLRYKELAKLNTAIGFCDSLGYAVEEVQSYLESHNRDGLPPGREVYLWGIFRKLFDGARTMPRAVPSELCGEEGLVARGDAVINRNVDEFLLILYDIMHSIAKHRVTLAKEITALSESDDGTSSDMPTDL